MYANANSTVPLTFSFFNNGNNDANRDFDVFVSESFDATLLSAKRRRRTRRYSQRKNRHMQPPNNFSMTAFCLHNLLQMVCCSQHRAVNNEVLAQPISWCYVSVQQNNNIQSAKERESSFDCFF